MWCVTTLTVAMFCATACAIAAEPSEEFLGKTQEQWVADLKSESASQRQLAAWALAQPQWTAVNGILGAAHHEDPVVRYWAVVGLIRIGEKSGDSMGIVGKAIYNDFTSLLKDKSSPVRLVAAEGLAGIFGHPNGFATLFEALSDPQEAVRIQAISGLERLGPKAAPLKEHIAKATADDTSEYVKRISTRLLGRLTAADDIRPVRIADVVNGHIHPSVCITPKGTLIVTYGRVNHRDLRISRSPDGGRTWEVPAPFGPTENKTYYPGSLTALADGRVVHAWNRWSAEDNEKEPRSVLYSLSSDEGQTWSDPQPFPRDEKVMSVIRHPLVELAPSQWLAALSDRTLVFEPASGTGKAFGDGRNHGLVPIVRTPKGTFVSGAGLRSTDGGKSWTPIEDFPNLKEQGWRHELVCLENGWLLASEILGPGVGGERIRYRISLDDGLTWDHHYEYYNPGRPIGGRACPRTVQLDDETIGVVYYDVEPQQERGPGLFFLRMPLAKLARP
jgi:hypothetical protein